MTLSDFFKNIVVWLMALVIVNQSIFFAFMGLLGIDYEGSESSSVYVFYLSILLLSTLVFYFLTVINRGFIKGELSALGIIFVFAFIHFLWVIFDPIGTELAPMFLIYSFVLGFVGLFSALTIVKQGLLDNLIRTAELVFVFQAVGIAAYSVLNTLSGNVVAALAGASYQALSYYSAFTMGMLALYNFILPSSLRYRFTSNFIYRILSYGLIFLSMLGVLVGGGRGAFLLMIAYFILLAYFSVFSDKKLTRKSVVKSLTVSVFIIFISVVFVTSFSQQEFVIKGFKRATAFITSDGVDLEKGSSGRDTVYATALEYIYSQPVLGYGPFGVRDKTIHAHNVFLEVWLQFGIFGLFVLPFIVYFLMKKARVLSRSQYHWGAFLLLYPIINIQFSSAYTTASSLWFVIGMVLLSQRASGELNKQGVIFNDQY